MRKKGRQERDKRGMIGVRIRVKLLMFKSITVMLRINSDVARARER